MKPCLRCGEPSDTSRCPDCRPKDERPRDRVTRANRSAWKNLSKRLRKLQPWCTACGSPGDLTVDHIDPLDAGGDPYDLDNLQVLCRSCNTRKHAGTLGGDPLPAASPTRGQPWNPSHTPGGIR